MTMIIERVVKRVLTLTSTDGPDQMIKWNRFYASEGYKKPTQASPDQGLNTVHDIVHLPKV